MKENPPSDRSKRNKFDSRNGRDVKVETDSSVCR